MNTFNIWLSNFFLLQPLEGTPLLGAYNFSLVILSYVIAVFTSYIALDFISRLRTEKHSFIKSYGWLFGGALAMGAGIWSMHFIGMLAFILPMSMSYHMHTTVASIAVAVIISVFALLLLKENNRSKTHLMLGGVVLGLGIATMHYVGMEAMKTHVNIHYIPSLFVGSIIVAIVVSEIAVWLSFASDNGNFQYKLTLKLISAFIMGAGICGMHYTGMYAAVFTELANPAHTMAAGINQIELAAYIAVIAITIIGIAQFISQYNKESLNLILQKKNEELENIQKSLKEMNETLEGRVSRRTIALEESVSFVKATLEATNDGIIVEDLNGKIRGYNQKFLKLLDLSENLMEYNSDKVFGIIAQLTVNPHEYLDNIINHHSNPELESSQIIHFKNGKVFERYSKSQVHKQEVVGRVWCFRDITARKQMEENLLYQATHDALTQLPNRLSLVEQLQKTLVKERSDNSIVALLYIGIDRFKIINDSLGHHFGDELLKIITERIKNHLKVGEIYSRLGGDEFVIVLDNVIAVNHVKNRAEEIHNIFNHPFELHAKKFNMTTSIGIGIYPEDGQTPTDLLKNAGSAMYQAKLMGGHAIHFYTAEMNKVLLRNLDIEQQLRTALINEEFILHYQPLLDLKTKNIVGVEALIRWNNPSLGFISPLEFIPIAEDTGLILEIGKWVLKTACQQVVTWQMQGIKDIKVAVNLSSKQLKQSDMMGIVKEVLDSTQLNPNLLELELTESGLIENSESIIQLMASLQDLGICLAIDDFGTGYSGLNYLKQFSIKKLKIDKSFIQDLATSQNSQKIVSSIINMAKKLSLCVLAEGIETKEQLDILLELQCDQGQGYYFSKPLSTSDCITLLLKKQF